MSAGFEIQLIAILVAGACSILGVFLVLKSMAMVSDAITHTILLGIVLAFFIVHDLNSPLLIIGAGIIGVLTVYLVELLNSTRLLKEDSAIGIVFPLLFSIAVILISKYTKNVHLDVDSVLLGELAFAPFNRIELFGLSIAKGLVSIFVIFMVNLVFVMIFFKELKISTFDKALAITLGMKPILVHYMLMSLVSITAVTSFEAVGSILVAILFDVSIAGSIALIIGILFIIVLIVSPKSGLISTIKRKRNQKLEFSVKILLIHLANHMNTPNEIDECGVDTLEYHLRWEKIFLNRVLKKAMEKKLIYIENRIFKLSDKGKEYLI